MTPNKRRRPGQEAARETFGVKSDSTASPRCPDCNRPVTRGGLKHDASCPVAAACEAAQRNDAFWFAARPGATQRRRPLNWAEGVELALLTGLPAGYRLAGDLLLSELQPGIRIRRYEHVYAVSRSRTFGGDDQ